MNFGFIIPTCCREDVHLKQLKRCILSVRTYYPIIKIILINDSLDKYNLYEFFKNDINIYIIKSYNKGSADQQVFKVLQDTELFDTAIIMQDSMLLNIKLEGIDNVKDIQFIWHFTNHRLHWDIIKEPATQFNIQNNIISHTDLIKYDLITNYNDNDDFLKFALDKLNNKQEWCGCFGSLCIINKLALKKMNDIIPFINLFVSAISNRNRRANESIFSLICYYTFTNINFEKSYDSLYYDGIKHNDNDQYRGKSTGFDNLIWCAVHKYFSKISFDR